MGLNFNQPITADLRAAVLQELRDAQIALARMLDGETLTGTPTNAIRYSSSNSRFEKFNGSTWAELSLGFLKLSGGTLSGTLTGAGGTFTSLTIGGSAVWHAGNFDPATKLGVSATATRANSVATSNPALGQGSIWATTSDLIFNNGSVNRTVWHDGNFTPSAKQDASTAWNSGNFNPATKQDASTAWHSGNFNPGSYAALSGAAFSGGISAANMGTGTLSASSWIRSADPAVSGTYAYLSANSNNLYLYHSSGSNYLTFSSAGNLSIAGAITAVGNITAYSDRRLKSAIMPHQVSINDLLSVQPKSYHYERANRTEIGLIAQDVQRILPTVVNEDDEGYLSLDYGRFAAIAVTSLIQELRSRGVL